jgi:hypothetical protein
MFFLAGAGGRGQVNNAKSEAGSQQAATSSSHSSGSGLFGGVGGGLLSNIKKGGLNIVKNIQQTAAMVKDELNAGAAARPGEYFFLLKI